MKMKTKYGNTRIDKYGYYKISSTKEGNNGKLLHRLIAKDYFGDWIDEPLIDGERIEIHHIDGNPLNNCVLNLLPLPVNEHKLLHHKDKTRSDETKLNISKSKNTTGYFRVTKHKDKKFKQGFTWKYQYTENGKQKQLYSVDIEKLEQKVKNKGLIWKKFKGENI